MGMLQQLAVTPILPLAVPPLVHRPVWARTPISRRCLPVRTIRDMAANIAVSLS